MAKHTASADISCNTQVWIQTVWWHFNETGKQQQVLVIRSKYFYNISAMLIPKFL